jgi:hypothetical protein
VSIFCFAICVRAGDAGDRAVEFIACVALPRAGLANLVEALWTLEITTGSDCMRGKDDTADSEKKLSVRGRHAVPLRFGVAPSIHVVPYRPQVLFGCDQTTGQGNNAQCSELASHWP